MSFGFSVGDFLAALQLAKTLYTEVFLVAKGAPEALYVLKGEIADLTLAIELLVEHTNNPESTLSKAGPDFVDRVNGVMERTYATLKGLEEFAKKYNFDKASGRKKYKIIWDKFQWAINVSSIDGFRSKIQYHSDLINLILTAAGNSSLERIEKSNAALNKSIEGINDKLSDAVILTTPVFSSIGEKSFQVSLSVALKEKAEIYRPWTSTSLNEWWTVGRWFFTKAQNQLSEDILATKNTIPIQAFTDLLKASWIVTDVLTKHPQLRFWSSTAESMQMINSQLQKLDRKAIPSLDQIENADLTIWDESWSKVSLKPSAQSGSSPSDTHIWRTSEGETVWQGFGSYAPPPAKAIDEVGKSCSWPQEPPETGCMILIVASKNFKSARILAQDQTGRSILSYPVTFQLVSENGFLQYIDLEAIYLKLPPNGIDRRPSHLTIRLGNHKIRLENHENMRLAIISLVAIVLLLESGSVEDPRMTLRALILLQSIAIKDLPLIRSQLNLSKSLSDSSFDASTAMWAIAEKAASAILDLPEELRLQVLVPQNTSLSLLSSEYKENYCNSWTFGLYQTPAKLLDDAIIEPRLWTSPLPQTLDLSTTTKNGYKAFIDGDKEIKVLAPNYTAVLATMADDSRILRKVLKFISGQETRIYSVMVVCQDSILYPSNMPDIMTLLQMAAWSHSITASSCLLDSPSYCSVLRCWDYEVSEPRRSQRSTEIVDKETLGRNLKDLEDKLRCDVGDAASRLLHQAINFHKCNAKHAQQRLCRPDSQSLQKSNSGCLARVREVEMIQYLLSRGANPNDAGMDGHTPLFHAVRFYQKDVIDMLLKAGADINATAANGRTCLHLAWDNGLKVKRNQRTREMLRYLLSCGARDSADKKGNSCLSQSVDQISIDKVRFLLESGLDIRQADMKRVSALFEKRIRFEARSTTSWKMMKQSFLATEFQNLMHVGLALNISVKSIEADEPFTWPEVWWTEEGLALAAASVAARNQFDVMDDFYDVFTESLLKYTAQACPATETQNEAGKHKEITQEAAPQAVPDIDKVYAQEAAPRTVQETNIGNAHKATSELVPA